MIYTYVEEFTEERFETPEPIERLSCEELKDFELLKLLFDPVEFVGFTFKV